MTYTTPSQIKELCCEVGFVGISDSLVDLAMDAFIPPWTAKVVRSNPTGGDHDDGAECPK